MNINATLFAQLIVFLILVFVTMKFIWPPLITVLDERSKKIADGLKAAEKGKQILISAEIEAGKILHQARFSVQEKIEMAEKQAKISAEEILANARSDAAKIISQAKCDVEDQIRLAKDVLREDVARLAIYGAEKILSKEIDESAHASILLQLKNEL